MNKRITVAVLVISALMLSTGAYLLFTNNESPAPTYRKTVQPPPEPTPAAPKWVDKGQEAIPDYSTADAEAHNATPASEEEAPSQVVEITEDRVVTFTFVENLAEFLLDRFQPVGADGKPVTTASGKTLNMFFGRSMEGFMVSGDTIRTARKNVLDYAFTPSMIRTLTELYTPLLMDTLIERAENYPRDYTVGVETEHRTLTQNEIRSMLRTNATEIRKVAAVFQGIADTPTIIKLAGRYLQAANAVDRANGQLQTAIADSKDTTLHGKRLKQAILQREEEKKAIIKQLRTICDDCSSGEMFYLVQWSYRRVLEESDDDMETFEAAATALESLGKVFNRTADTL